MKKGREKRKCGAEKRKSDAEKRQICVEKRNCTLRPPFIFTQNLAPFILVLVYTL